MKVDANDYYYVHDHLYSPAVLAGSSGTVFERYEYDAYGNCYVLEPNFAPDPDGESDYGNPYLFTGRRVDILDSGSLKIQYNLPSCFRKKAGGRLLLRKMADSRSAWIHRRNQLIRVLY